MAPKGLAPTVRQFSRREVGSLQLGESAKITEIYVLVVCHRVFLHEFGAYVFLCSVGSRL